MQLHGNENDYVDAPENLAHVARADLTATPPAALSMDYEGEINSPPLDETELEHYWAVGGSD